MKVLYKPSSAIQILVIITNLVQINRDGSFHFKELRVRMVHHSSVLGYFYILGAQTDLETFFLLQ